MKWNLWLLAGMFVAASCKNEDKGPTVSQVDRDFAVAAAETNLLGVRTGQLVETNAQSQEVKNYALSMSDYYNEATKDLGALARSKSISLPTILGTASQQEYATLAGLTGAKFDSAYVDWAVRSNQRAIESLQLYRNETTDTKFQQWVDARLTTLQNNQKKVISLQETMKSKMNGQ